MGLKLMLVAGLGLALPGLFAQIDPMEEVAGVFHGSSPCGPTIRSLLQISDDPAAELIEWRLSLNSSSSGSASGSYQLQYDCGPSVAGIPGLGAQRKTVT